MQPFQEIQNMDPAGYPVMNPGGSDQGYGYYIGSDPGDSGSVGSNGGGMAVYYPNGGGGVIIPTDTGAGVIGVGPGQQNPLAGPVVMPAATAAMRPSVSDTVAAGTLWDWFNAPATPMPPVLTPLSLTRPMPSIVQSAPVDVSIPVCDPVSQWVSDNPVWAVGLLAVAAVFLLKR